jgi:hypothetical protein
MSRIVAAVLVILWTITGCAPAGPASPSPPPQDDRSGMH